MPTDSTTISGVIAVAGAGGFLGFQFAKALSRHADIEIRALTRSTAIPQFDHGNNIVALQGNLADPAMLAELLQPGCSVANFAFDSNAAMHENLAIADAFAEGCIKHGVKRVLHCSTAMVIGGTDKICIDETTECRPRTAYEKTKYAIENLLLEKARGRFDLVILRPTAVFGPGGRNLLKMANDLTRRPRLINQLRSIANGSRRLNLVAAENVTAAAIHLLQADSVNQEIFIVSDDEAPGNNFRDVENHLMRELGIPSYPAHLSLPKTFVEVLLRLRGRSLVNPDTRFACDKLRRSGFDKPLSFDTALAEFISWYKKSYQTTVDPGRCAY